MTKAENQWVAPDASQRALKHHDRAFPALWLGMAAIIRVSIEIESVVTAEDEDRLDVVRRLRAGLSRETIDPDLVLWLLDGAAVRAEVSP